MSSFTNIGHTVFLIMFLTGRTAMTRSTPTPIRDLISGTDFSNCQEGNLSDQGIYSDGACADYDKYWLKEEYVNKTESYESGYNMIKSGYLKIEDFDGKLSLHAHPNITQLSQQFCLWDVRISDSKKAKIIITRDTKSYEEIYIRARTIYENIEFVPKFFSSGDKKSQIITLEETSYISVKVNILNSKSDFYIEILQESGNNNDFCKFAVFINLIVYIVIIVIGIIVPCAIFSGILLLTFMLCKGKNKRRQELSRYEMNKKLIKRRVFIDSLPLTLDNGEFQDVGTYYEESSGIICLEEYSSDSKVVLIQGGNHSFHGGCLQSWLRKIKIDDSLLGPHGKSKINEPMDIHTISKFSS